MNVEPKFVGADDRQNPKCRWRREVEHFCKSLLRRLIIDSKKGGSIIRQGNLKTTKKPTSFPVWNMKSVSLCFKTLCKELACCFSKAVGYTCHLRWIHSVQWKWVYNVRMLHRSTEERTPTFISCTSSLDWRLESFLLEFGGAHSFWHCKHMVENATIARDVLIIMYPLICLEKLALLSSPLSSGYSKKLLCDSP